MVQRATQQFGSAESLRSVARSGFRALLVATLAVCSGLAPVAQLAHIAFADHDHRYCPAHQQIEDVPRGELFGPHAHPQRLLGSASAAPWLEGATDAALQIHLACTFLNCSGPRAPRLQDAPPDAPALAVQYVEYRPDPRCEHPQLAPLRTAPKTSPPLRLA